MNIEEKFSVSHFLAMFCSRQNAIGHDDCYNDFLKVANTTPVKTIVTDSFVVYLLHTPSTKVSNDYCKQVTLVLHGEIYNKTNNQPEFLLKQFMKHGLDFSKDINGSFAVLVIDKRNDTVIVVTDRLNSRKVFYSKDKGNYWLSSSLNLHPTNDVGIDPVGVAHYLASGAIHNNRTLFDGIRVLDRACIHKLGKDGFHGTSYWSYEFTNNYSDIAEEKLRDGLSELLFESVRLRLHDNPKVFLSLSGGVDSRAVLGILSSKLGIKDIECFSYALGEPKPNSDEYVARQVANYLGIRHKIIKSCTPDLPLIVENSAKFGRGMVCETDCEVDAYMDLVYDFSSAMPNVLFVADECFGYYDWEVDSNINALKCVRIFDFSVLSWLNNMLPNGTYNMLSESLDEDIQQMVDRCPPTEDYHNSMDFLYLDQRLPNVLLSSREFLAGQFMIVRNPFLDNSILDFMKQLPRTLRRGKVLYMKTITNMFPDLYKIKTAHTYSYFPDWKSELANQTHAVERMILSKASGLDDLILPEVILKLLRGNLESKGSSLRMLIADSIRRLLRETALHESFIERKMSSYYYRFPVKKVDFHSFIRRALIIRSAVSK